MRFKAWCAQCGHSAACHEGRSWCSSCLILLTIAALLAGSIAMFGNQRHGTAVAADVSASAASRTAVKE